MTGIAILLSAALSASLIAAAPLDARAATIDADSADDVCAVSADPCIVTDVVRVADGATLDFATRTVSVEEGGRFEFYGESQVLCGDFFASTSGPALVALPPAEATQWAGVVARRACSANGGIAPCASDGDCNLGSCGIRRCDKQWDRECSGDEDCQGGVCSGETCQNFPYYDTISCQTNADCDLGSCPAQYTCRETRGYTPLACSSHADCQNGTCSIGSASIHLDGAVDARSEPYPGNRSFFLEAADSVLISKPMDLSALGRNAEASLLYVDAKSGNVVVTGEVNAAGGGFGIGGDLSFVAGNDVEITAPVDAVGGLYDGGYLYVDAGRDAHLGASVDLRARAQDGYGGWLDVYTGRDILVDGGPEGRRIRLLANGHSAEGFGGAGGQFIFDAKGNLTITDDVRMVLNGAKPDGYGGLLFVEAEGDIQFDADVKARSRIDDGDMGLALVDAEGALTVGSSSSIDANEVVFEAGGDLLAAGDVDVDARFFNRAGTVEMISGATATLDGSIDARGKSGGQLEVAACRLIVDSNSSIGNDAHGGLTSLTARESMELRSGSRTSTDFGINRLTYRTPAKPPVINGLVTPAPELVVDPLLAGCPVCGNSEIDESESCDDGNVADGDGCSAGCQIE
jgi:cysteine-rich repeat protein